MLVPIMRNFTLNLGDGYQPILDEKTHRAILFLRSAADTDIGPYTNEYILILTLSEDGTEIDEIVEFADSAYSQKWFRKLCHVRSKL